MAYIVALTGGIGSGKSTVADMFARLGVPVTDADIIARQVVEPGTPALQAIAEHFGPRILTADGALDRAALRREIFADPEEKAWLNQLLHPLIHQETRRQLNNVTAPYAFGWFLCWLKITLLPWQIAYWLWMFIRTNK